MLAKQNLKESYNKKHLKHLIQYILKTVCLPFKVICVFNTGFSFSMTIDSKLQRLLILHRFKIVIDIGVLAGFAVVNMLKYFAAFVGSFLVFDLSEKLSGCLSHVGDGLTFRASIFVNDIRIESFRAFAFVVEIVGYFSAVYAGLISMLYF